MRKSAGTCPCCNKVFPERKQPDHNTVKKAIGFALLLICALSAVAQQSVARQWNEMLLEAISGDFARPPIHARNLYHISAAMYDAWAVYNPDADTYFLGKTVHGFHIPFHRIPPPADPRREQEAAISFAAYRLLQHRYAKSPGYDTLSPKMDALMRTLGYNPANTSTNYRCSGAEMGNYLAQKVIEYGLQDGSNEVNDYAIQFYQPVNPPMLPVVTGDPTVLDLNRWQPLQFTQFIDQSGNNFGNLITKFQSPEWGAVQPFSLDETDAKHFERDGHAYTVWHDPGPPARIDTAALGAESDEYKWNFALVAAWSSLLDPADGVMMDISPASLGNNDFYPENWADYHDFYNFETGGDRSQGRLVNPKTGQPYTPQIVRRADYARVLAEFWADGPRSVTPPGHWFEILNYVNDQPNSARRIGGTGPLCDDLEWDVKCYFALGGAMHDAAVTAWGIKGWYDYVRPITAIRGMAEHGQSSDPSLPNFHPAGLPLIPGFIEVIQPGDPLALASNQFAGEIKIKAWRGPGYIPNPANTVAGVAWIRAKNWYPYQRPTFVTPPFAGYISGHSTYSRAAAELLGGITGDPFFPNGMGTFYCKKNEYLVFEDGPSEDVTLQWATYRDASDQCSLSRIFGGIHPPMDDMPGRLIGIKIGQEALAFAEKYFTKPPSPPDSTDVAGLSIFPNPTDCVVQIEYAYDGALPVKLYSADGRLVLSQDLVFNENAAILNLGGLTPGVYMLEGRGEDNHRLFTQKIVRR